VWPHLGITAVLAENVSRLVLALLVDEADHLSSNHLAHAVEGQCAVLLGKARIRNGGAFGSPLGYH